VAFSVIGLVIGVVLLAFASDQFVIGAARIAVIRRVAPIVVGVIIVGFGTSTPELLVSASAAASGQPEIAIGNIIGSNVVNLSLILGIGAVILPLRVRSMTVRREAPLTVAGMLLFLLLVQDGISSVEGFFLVLMMAGAFAIVIRRDADSDLASDVQNFAGTNPGLGVEIARTVAGLIGTLAGAQLLLTAAIDLADRAGLSKGFVGATLVAIGTSLPELVTVIQSARRGEGDLILGNLLGSNLFNALAVGGVVGIVGNNVLDAPRLTGVAAAAAVVLGLIVWAMMATGHRVRRREGAALIVAYAVLIPLLVA
jgi:cation:H+ antiporter